MGLINGNGYHFDPDAIKELTKGINDAMSELKELGFDIEAQLGRGFDKLALDAVECGDDGLASDFSSFCDRWGWGVYHLMQDANAFSKKLRLTAGLYYEQEQYVSDVLKDGVNAAIGDPTKSAKELHGTSWGDVLADNPITQFQHADWDPTSQQSREGFQKVQEAAGEFGDDVTSIPDRLAHGGEEAPETTAEFRGPDPTHRGSGK